jgi:membrane fusion protein, copper/silver efflux system
MAMCRSYLIVLAFMALQVRPAIGAETTHDHSNTSVLQDASIIGDRAEVAIPILQQKNAGIQTQFVKRERLVHKIRTVGSIATDQTREAHIHTRINGWIEKIHIDYVGKVVAKGAPLFDLYSPDLVSTQEEYLAAKRQGQVAAEVAEAALTRLRLWGVPEQELDALRSARAAKKALTFYAPVSGVVIRKAAIMVHM